MKHKEKTAVSNLLHNLLELPERYSNDLRETEVRATEESINTELSTESKHLTGCKRGKNVLPAGSPGKSDVIQFTVKVIVASDWMI